MQPNIADQLIDYWSHQKSIVLREGATSGALGNLESAKKVILPNDLRSLYLLADGFDLVQGAQDERGFSFWPSGQLTLVSEHENGRFGFIGAQDYAIFCDYLGWSWAYAINITSGSEHGVVVMIGTSDNVPFQIAGSFSVFAHLYLSDAPLLYGP